MTKYYSDAEFIETWRAHRSGAKVAEALNLPRRAVAERRRRLERIHNISLGSDDPRAQKYAHMQVVPKSPRLTYKLQDGIAILFSDCHYWPGIISTAHRALLKFCKDLQPKLVICNGDAFDGARISRYPHTEMFDARPHVIDELKTVQERLGEIADAAPKSVRIWSLGNHDARFEHRLATTVPEFSGVKGFHLKDHFPDWQPTMSVYINDNVMVKHRFRGGIHAAHNNTLWAGKSIFTGHLHNLQVLCFSDYDGTRYGVDTGTLADPYGPQFHYTEDNPVNWRSGFIVATFHKGELLWPEPVHVVRDGVVQFRGCVYPV